MAWRELLFLGLAVFAAAGWIVFSGKDGYTGNNAMVVARSISVAATIDGKVDGEPPAVGTKVAAGDLLARLSNGRIDRSRLAELESQEEFLRSEINRAREEKSGVKALLERYETRMSEYLAKMITDTELSERQTRHALEAARERVRLKQADLERMISLDTKSLVTKFRLQEAQTEELIARNEVAALEAMLSRIKLKLGSLAGEMMLSDNGDTSYWEKTADSLSLRLFDNRLRLSMLQAQLKQVQAQAAVERGRLKLNFVEEHRAPFDGVINAVFTNQGKHVISGTPLLEILDCDNPIAIVPIPEDRFGDFSIGQKVTVVPFDSEEAIKGTVQHISSGPLIGRDTTIAVQQTMTLDGSKVIVRFDDPKRVRPAGGPCDAARKAIATIHMRSLFDELLGVGTAVMAAIDGRTEWRAVFRRIHGLLGGPEPSDAPEVAAAKVDGGRPSAPEISSARNRPLGPERAKFGTN